MAVGIVLVNYNGGEVLKLTLDSLLRARVSEPFTVCLVENGSAKQECEYAQREFEKFSKIRQNTIPDTFIRSEKNLGFCGGNNIGIQRFLEMDEIDRICLLNTDVIVSDGWLDKLMESDAEVVGPVTNANGNEQTIWIDYDAERNFETFERVKEFAAFREKIYRGYEVNSECVTGFCSLIKRSIFEDVGLLDERYYPGGFDDCDFDRRVLDAGGRIAIRRDCFLHHWGGGSFSKLAMPERVGISFANMKRYEEKWMTEWRGTQRLLPVSLLQDVDFLRKNGIADTRAWSLVRKTGDAIGDILERHEVLQINVDRQSYQDDIEKQMLRSQFAEELKPRQKQEIHLQELPYLPDPGIKGLFREIESAGRTLYHAVRAPERRKKRLQVVLDFINQRKTTGRGTIAILAPIWREEKLKDGYFQRIYAVDQVVLKGYRKLYLESDSRHPFSIESVDDEHMVIHYSAQNKELASSLKMLMKACGVVYAHSLLRFVHTEIESGMLHWLTEGHIKLIWDVHGSVPEEAAYCDNWIGAQMYNTLEEILMNGAGRMICVNYAMKEHFQKKYDYLPSQPKSVIMPIFQQIPEDETLFEKKINGYGVEKPMVIYAGGLQLWQNIEMMQDIISATGDFYCYNMLVSSPGKFREMYGERAMPSSIRIHSVAPEEIQKEYEKSHFGFILRDDVCVNQVACPTKLIEYLSYGILPVMSTTHIGDFIKYGMEYIPIEDFEAGRIPSNTEFREKIYHNRQVLEQLKIDFERGKEEILNYIEGDEV